MNGTPPADESTWLVRHEFLIRRLHSLSGLVPLGIYTVIHLFTNATILNSAASFQSNVFRIHSLGRFLWIVEWGFILLPLLFHAILGVVIVRSGLPNSGTYSNSSNIRYTLQRVTGIIAFFFLIWHVFHMHGWFHFEIWKENVADPLVGSRFRPYNAASSVALALQGIVVPVIYAIGVLSVVFHLANGIWTMGITWGAWISEGAQRRASWVCLAFGVGLAAVGLSALYGAITLDVTDALQTEQRMLEAKLAAEGIPEGSEEFRERQEHKGWTPEELQQLQSSMQESANAEGETLETVTHD